MCRFDLQQDTHDMSGIAWRFLILVEALKRYGLLLLDLREGKKNMTTLLALSSAGG